jgi:hypothetical protein
MTKDLGNAARGRVVKAEKSLVPGWVAPAAFPLIVAALGYVIGKQFFGF